jgi:ComF family protein
LARARYAVANLLFPPLCAGCDERGTWLCKRCFASVPAMDAIPGRCKRCDLPIVSGRCGCASLHPKVSRAVSAHPYAGWVSRSVVGIKYEGEKDRARFLGAVLAVSRASDLLARGDVVVPVPMFERKRRERGYNQVELMAEEACALLGAPGPRPVLIQHEERRSQVGLSARERRDNVRGSFSLNPEVVIHPGARIVLVDDVRTTGATLSACVEVVRAIRPRRIDVVTLAAELPGEVMRDLGLES